MYVPFTAAHTPLQAPKEVIALYYEKYADTGLSQKVHDKRAAVAAMTHIMDKAIGRILHAIEERGWKENTLVVFFNDDRVTQTGPVLSLVWTGALFARCRRVSQCWDAGRA